MRHTFTGTLNSGHTGTAQIPVNTMSFSSKEKATKRQPFQREIENARITGDTDGKPWDEGKATISRYTPADIKKRRR